MQPKRPTYCNACGDEDTQTSGNIQTCNACGESEAIDELRWCAQCGTRLKTNHTAREGHRRVSKSCCPNCGFRIVSYTQIVSRAVRHFERGTGFNAFLNKITTLNVREDK